MTFVGFDANLAVQHERAITGLSLFYSGFPILGTLIAILIMRNYSLSEQRANEIKKALEIKRAAQ